MQTENVVLMRQARESMKGKWGIAIGTTLIYFLISGCFQAIPKAGPLLSLLVTPQLGFGICVFSLTIARNKEPRVEQLFDGFKLYGKLFFTYLRMLLFILLWMLLLIIPGIMVAFSYSMTFYVLADNPSLGPKEAMDKSKALMDGHRMKLFRLSLRFFGLVLLSAFTLFIGLLWLIPYMQVCTAKFYDDIIATPVVLEQSESPLPSEPSVELA